MPTKRILIVDDEESIQTVVQFGIQMVSTNSSDSSDFPNRQSPNIREKAV